MYVYFVSMFLFSSGNLPSQTLNILWPTVKNSLGIGWGTLCESNRNPTKFSFFHPPQNNICFVWRAKAKLSLQGPTLSMKALKSKESGIQR